MRVLVCLSIAALVACSVSASAQDLDRNPRDATTQSLEKENAELKKEIGALREQLKLRKQHAALKAELESPEEATGAPSGRTATVSRQAAKAYAADLPVKAAPRIFAPVANWTGFYAGGNVGYGWGNSDPSETGSGRATSILGGGTQPPSPPIAFGGPHNQTLNGVLGGLQIGYNYQHQNWILGLETDVQVTGQKTNGTLVDPIAGVICIAGSAVACSTTAPFNGSAVTGYRAQLDWFGTVRGRVGFLVTDQTLFYATGGLAYGHVGVSGTSNVSSVVVTGGLGATSFVGNTNAFSASKTNVGFAVGGGIEGKLTSFLPASWSWKLEYLYLDLGSLNASAPFATIPSQPCCWTNFVGATNYHSHFTESVVRAGLNYQFH